MATSTLQVQPGARVETSDGKDIGCVAEVFNGHFKVDVSWRPDYWLPTSVVQRAQPDCLALGVTKDDLDAYRVDKPMDRSDGGIEHRMDAPVFDEGDAARKRAQFQGSDIDDARARTEAELRVPPSILH